MMSQDGSSAAETQAPSNIIPLRAATVKRKRPDLEGGVHTEADALKMLNAHFLIGVQDGVPAIFRICDNNDLAFLSKEQFQLAIENVTIEKQNLKGTSYLQGHSWWRKQDDRNERDFVFKPHGELKPWEFNLWRGWNVVPTPGRALMTPLVDNIWKVICRKDRAKFTFLLNWLAWCVQHPDEAAEVVIVLISEHEGAGKTLLSRVMRDIFGRHHGKIIDDPSKLTGRFNNWLNGMCFLGADEILFQDDRTVERLKGMVTTDDLFVEYKNGPHVNVPNRLHMIFTTNRRHGIKLGAKDRRYVVMEVSEDRIGDVAYFNRIHTLLDAGGTGQFLDFLLQRDLGNWHPRQILKTAEAFEHQRMGSDSVSQWLLASADADKLVGHPDDNYQLEAEHPTSRLYAAYTGFQKAHPVVYEAFGTQLKRLFVHKRITVTLTSRDGSVVRKDRPMGYVIPSADEVRAKVLTRLGVPTEEVPSV
jgi:Family of unknown function (DUF5906)